MIHTILHKKVVDIQIIMDKDINRRSAETQKIVGGGATNW